MWGIETGKKRKCVTEFGERFFVASSIGFTSVREEETIEENKDRGVRKREKV